MPHLNWRKGILMLAAGAVGLAAPVDGRAGALEDAIRFKPDRAGYVRQFDPIMLRPIVEGGNALPVGNGDLAAVIWQPGDLTVMLNKCDIGGTSQAARLTVRTPDKLADRVGTLESRLSLYDATASIAYEGGKLPQDTGGSWRGRGAAPKPTDKDFGTVKATAYVPNGRNVFLLDYREEAKSAHPVTLIFERWIQNEYGDKVAATVNDKTLAITYAMKEKSGAVDYVAVLAFTGFEGATLQQLGPVQTAVNIPAGAVIAGRIAVAVVTKNEAADPLAAATKLAQDTLRADPATLRKEHQAYWQSFWDKLFVDAGHPYLTALYHMSLYELGITSRGRRPVQFNGALNLWNEATRMWGDGYWCHNQSEAYLQVYAANHVELADNFHDWIVRVRPEAMKAAMKYFGVQGAHYPEVMDYNYAVQEPDKPQQPSGVGYILSSGVRYALMLWNRYQYTLDEAFLRDKAYPVIRDCAEFYVNYAKPGSDGLYHVAPTISWEELPVGRDAHADCAAWRAIFPLAIRTAEQLGVDQNRVPVWKDRLAKAPPWPTQDNLFSVVMRDDGTPEPTDHFQWQLPNLSSVFPYSIIGIGSESSLKKLADDTFVRYRFNADAGHEFLPVIAARLGNAEWWRAAMFQYIQFMQVYDQGLFHYYNIFGNKEKDSGNTAGLHPYLEASGILATAVNEMLLQSHDGVIRVFPATPERWPARFILRAAGSFLVASEHRGREGIAYVAIEPQGGGKRACRVAVPWADGCELAAKGRSNTPAVKNGIVEFEAEPGTVYVLTPKGKKIADVPAIEAGFKTQYSPCRLGNVWYGTRDGANNHTVTFPLW